MSLRTGRHASALKRLEEAKTILLEVEAEQEIPAVDAYIAECRIAMEMPTRARARRDMLGRTTASNSVFKLVPDSNAHMATHFSKGDVAAARIALGREPLAAGRDRRKFFETATYPAVNDRARLTGGRRRPR